MFCRFLRTMSTSALSHPLSFLVGTWRGVGVGIYPTIKTFNYGEEIIISQSPKGFLVYHQKTWNQETKQPLHAEMGYFRTPGMGETVELVAVAPNGLASVEEGTISGTTLSLRSKALARTSTARPPYATEFTRTINVDVAAGKLSYVFDMAAGDASLQRHLEAALEKVEG
ncbi:hypothetical protein BC937DRAFT_87539 [Endogone sp. FLAS-F59071]|nr:hypothetical protein BC937DRAFT_87539 [Endogone sp. FLAS-F59071]|eukprot:RUS22728.1 hypothetical protein BC937DRAFT_87539 [Endogone sp. FLAS-F59071]